MKILHVEDFFYPNAGYQINILPSYLTKLGHENIILTTEYEKAPEKLKSFFGKNDITLEDRKYIKSNNVKIIRLPIYGFKSGRAIWKVNTFLKNVKDINPDIIYFHGNDSFISIMYLLFYWNKKVKLIFDSHMLDMASKNKFSKLFRLFYRKLITPIIRKNNLFIIRVQDSTFVNDEYDISKELTPFISFGTDTDLFNREKYSKDKMKEKLDIENEVVYLYSGKLDEAKGGLLLAQAFEKSFGTESINLLIIGNIPNNTYGEAVRKSLEKSENKITILPTQKYKELPKYYSIVDFAVFPKQCSLSYFDLQSMGIPIIFEDNEINRGRNTGGNNYIFMKDNIEDFRQSIYKTLQLSQKDKEIISNNIVKEITEKYNYYDIAKEYEYYIKKSFEL